MMKTFYILWCDFSAGCKLSWCLSWYDAPLQHWSGHTQEFVLSLGGGLLLGLALFCIRLLFDAVYYLWYLLSSLTVKAFLGHFSDMWRSRHFWFSRGWQYLFMDWYHQGQHCYCIWGACLQVDSEVPSWLPLQTSHCQIWHALLPSQCWPIWQHMPWYFAGNLRHPFFF